MAKQYGIHKIGGKVDGQSYYYSKNGGFVSRKINPGMSARVKEGKEYANTRLNNAEFGAAGSLAGAMVGTVSQRWRYILDSIATGKLVKVIKAAMMQDTTNPWGQRTVPLAEMAGIQEAYNRFSKNQVPDEVIGAMKEQITINKTTSVLQVVNEIQLSIESQLELIDKGATALQVSVFAFNITKPEIGADGKSYKDPAVLFVNIPSLEVGGTLSRENEMTLIDSTSIQNSPAIFNEESHLGGVLLVLKPVKVINENEYILQELCSACWVPAKEVTA